METKKEIRMHMLKKRRGLTPEERGRYSREISGLLLSYPLFVRAADIYCYAAFREEVSTRPLMEAAWKMGKKVALPKVTGDTTMGFFYIDSLEELRPGYRGILEPDTKRPAKNESALILLPGAAFDRSGNRLGYGGGFYDAYLQEHPAHRKIALAFSVQCVQSLPAEPHDVQVDGVLTEKGWFYLC